MDGLVVWELLLILLLVLANGLISVAEISITSADRSRLRQLADGGDRGALRALELALDPNPVTSTARLGISLAVISAAALGGLHTVISLENELGRIPNSFVDAHRAEIALALFVTGLTAVTVVFGELIPKRLALHNPIWFARCMSRPLSLMCRAARPCVRCLEWTADFSLLLLGIRDEPKPSVSLQEIQDLIQTGTAEGVLEPVEQKLAVEALNLAHRIVRQIMKPRIDIDAADVNTPPPEVLGVIAMAGFSRLPIYDGDLDHILGFIHLKDVLRQQYLGWPLDLRKMVRPALFVPETMHIDQLLMLFQERHNQLAIVVDEFGATKGMVTLEDVLEQLVGQSAADVHENVEQSIVQRDDTSWLVDGSVNIDELLEHLHREHLEGKSPRNVSTVAGLVLFELGRIPQVGEKTSWNGLNLEVVDMDGQRIDKLLVSVGTPTEGA